LLRREGAGAGPAPAPFRFRLAQPRAEPYLALTPSYQGHRPFVDATSTDAPGASPALDSADSLRAEVERLRLIQQISNQFNSSLDFDALLPQVFRTVLATLGAEGGSLWVAEGDLLTCRLAVGRNSQRMIGAQMPVGTGFIGDVAQRPRTTVVTQAIQDPRFDPAVDATDDGAASP
jgi:hypothetical protein